MKILFCAETQWAFGAIHKGLAAYLRFEGHEVNVQNLDEAMRSPRHYDRIVTITNCVPGFSKIGVPADRLTIVAHSEQDIALGIKEGGFDRFSGYACVSNSLHCSSIAMGEPRVPTVVRLGVDKASFSMPHPTKLRSVGYASIMERFTDSGIDLKRGALAKQCAEAAGLEFRAAYQPPRMLSNEQMPAWYASVDCVIVPSLIEGASMPALEAAAAGRLVLSTPVGHVPQLAVEGCAHLFPFEEKAFRVKVVECLLMLKNNSDLFSQTCADTWRNCRRDWRDVGGDWSVLLGAR